MYKNQLQELAQRSCFNLPWYTCVREGPDHAPRFKAVVNFNGDIFESPHYCSTLRQAEHTAAEAALISLSSRHSLAARILDETGVYKNLLQAIAQRVGSPLPQYTTFRSGSGHLPVFTGTVELAGITFTGESAKNKKQAEKNAARAAWLSLKLLAQQDATLIPEQENNSDEHEQMRIARALQNYRLKEKIECASQNQNRVTIPFQQKFLGLTPRPSSPQRPTVSTSKILPLFCQKNPAQPNMRRSQSINNSQVTLSQPLPSSSRPPSPELRPLNLHRLPVIDAAPYVPIRHCRSPYQGVAPPVTLRTSTPVFSAPPRPFPQPVRVAPPVRIKQAVTPVFTALPPVRKEDPPSDVAAPVPSKEFLNEDKETASDGVCDVDESIAVKCIEQLEM